MCAVTKNRNHIKHQALFRTCKWGPILGLSALLATSVFCPSAYADDDPFQIDTAHWMSFDHYKDADKRGTLALIKPQPAPEDSAPVLQAPSVAPIKSSAVPPVAPPTRPIDLPLMPGLNKGFNVNITSTEEQHISAVPVIDVKQDEPEEPSVYSDKNWQSPKSIQKADSDEDSDKPLNVRMSFLPNQTVQQKASPEHVSAQKLGHEEMLKAIATKTTPIPPAKTPAEVAACAAIDAYKKQQLQAIQTDRQTLKALQDAVHSLGLDKQLDFMAGNSSTLNVSGTQPTTPATTTIR
jgi:hypothetical protein